MKLPLINIISLCLPRMSSSKRNVISSLLMLMYCSLLKREPNMFLGLLGSPMLSFRNRKETKLYALWLSVSIVMHSVSLRLIASKAADYPKGFQSLIPSSSLKGSIAIRISKSSPPATERNRCIHQESKRARQLKHDPKSVWAD